MTPEEKLLLEQTHKLSQENNELLKQMRKSSRVKTWLQIGYWVVIIVLSVGGVYFFQLYINSLSGAFGVANGSGTSATGTGQNQSFVQELQQALGGK